MLVPTSVGTTLVSFTSQAWMEPSFPSAAYTKWPLGWTATVMMSVTFRLNGEPTTAVPSTPVVELIGNTFTLFPAPLPSTAIRNFGVVGFALVVTVDMLSEHDTRVNAMNASSTVNAIINLGLITLLLRTQTELVIRAAGCRPAGKTLLQKFIGVAGVRICRGPISTRLRAGALSRLRSTRNQAWSYLKTRRFQQARIFASMYRSNLGREQFLIWRPPLSFVRISQSGPCVRQPAGAGRIAADAQPSGAANIASAKRNIGSNGLVLFSGGGLGFQRPGVAVTEREILL